MNASIRSNLPPPNRHPIKRVVGMFTTKKLMISQHGDVEKTPPQVDSSSPEEDRNNIGAAMRNEKIENARSIVNADRQQRQKNTATPVTAILQNTLRERLEAKLLADEVECTQLRKLAEVGKRGIPLSLASLHLGFELEKDTCLGEKYLLRKLEALIFEKQNECTEVHKLLVVARKRGTSRTERRMARFVSLPTHPGPPQSILRRQPYSGSLKSVSWG
jgi:hypothetical protein